MVLTEGARTLRSLPLCQQVVSPGADPGRVIQWTTKRTIPDRSTTEVRQGDRVA